MHLLWPSHFDAVCLGPSLAQRHHEVRDEAHLFKLPLPVLLDILVVIAGRHQVALSFVDWSGLQVTEAGAPVTLQMDDMIVDVLLDEGNAERDFPITSLW